MGAQAPGKPLLQCTQCTWQIILRAETLQVSSTHTAASTSSYLMWPQAWVSQKKATPVPEVSETGLGRTERMEREIERSIGAAVWLCFGMVQAAKEQQGEDYEGFAKHWDGPRGSGVHFCCTAMAFELHPILPVSHRHFTLPCRATPSLSPCTWQLITPKGSSGAVCSFLRIKDSHPEQSTVKAGIILYGTICPVLPVLPEMLLLQEVHPSQLTPWHFASEAVSQGGQPPPVCNKTFFRDRLNCEPISSNVGHLY